MILPQSTRLGPLLPGCLFFLILSFALLSPALAQAVSEEEVADPAAEAYAACMSAARQDPERALEEARAWRDRAAESGEDDAPARHCEAVAQLSLGQYEDAALHLEALVEDLDDTRGELRPDLLAQAGQAWLLAGDEARAEAAQSAALEIRPRDVDLLVDRALTRHQAGEAQGAVEDLDRAAELSPEEAEIYVYRASAYRLLEDYGLARDDLERALELEPNHLEGLLERGNLHRLEGETEAARADWQRVIDLAPDSPAAEAAAYNLERIGEPLEE